LKRTRWRGVIFTIKGGGSPPNDDEENSFTRFEAATEALMIEEGHTGLEEG
jgi:hypothetical protein